MSFDAYTTSGQGQNLFQQLPIQSTRDPVNGVDFNDPTGGPYQIGRRWFNKTNSNYWHYIGQGNWVLDASGTGAILGVDVPVGSSPIFADSNGLVNFTSNGGTITISGSAGGLGAQDINFDVAGGAVISKFAVDAATAPGTNPVLPTGGQITIEGGATYATGTRTNPIRTDSLAASTIDIEIQLAGNNAATASTTKFGVSQFDSNQFDVNSGFVQLKGGGINPALTKLAVQTGTTPVVPSATGQINFNGATVAAGSNPVRTDGTGANTVALEIQTSQAIASTDATKIGLSSYDSSKFTVDANGFVSLSSSALTQGVINLGMSQSGGTTFTVNSANGTALSATNPAVVYLQSLANPGNVVTYTITANQSFTQANIASNNFGLTNGLAFASDIPFYLYAVCNAAAGVNPETAIAFMVSRYPNTSVSPVAGKIAKSGSAVANSAGSFFSLSNVTVADYASSPCICVGSFRMQWLNTNNWVIQTFNAKDGIGNFQEGVQFGSVAGHFGNASGSFFKANGGTAPIYTSQAWVYYLGRDNRCSFNGVFSNNSTPGAGAVTALQGIPFQITDGGTTGPGFLNAGAAYSFILLDPVSISSQQYQFDFVNDTATGVLQNASIGTSSIAHNGSFTVLFS